MALRFTVQEDSEQACQSALELLCRALGLIPIFPPRQILGGRWMARAAPSTTTKAPVDDRGTVASG